MSGTDRHDPVQGKIVHEYDGILEADNDLPRWWLGIFVASTVFAVFYWFAYETWEFASYPIAEYREALAEAAASGDAEVTDELLETIAANDAVVARGRTAYETNCVVCHGSRAEGDIGPNLTDGSWLHGGAATDIHRTVRDGVSDRGMPGWGQVLGAPTVQAVAAYVLTLRGTNVPGKAAQGEPWVPGVSNSAEDSGAEDVAEEAPAVPGPSADLHAPGSERPEI